LIAQTHFKKIKIKNQKATAGTGGGCVLAHGHEL
jgi:hypothetical protein